MGMSVGKQVRGKRRDRDRLDGGWLVAIEARVEEGVKSRRRQGDAGGG